MHKILLILATILGVSGCSHGEGSYQPNPARDAMILQLMGSRQPMPVYAADADTGVPATDALADDLQPAGRLYLLQLGQIEQRVVAERLAVLQCL